MTTYNTARLRAAIIRGMRDVTDRGLITEKELKDILEDMSYRARLVTTAAIDQWLESGAKEALREAIRDVLERRNTQ